MINKDSFQSRLRIVSWCVFLFACILVLKLFFVQIIHKNSYTERADRQYATPVGDIFERGTIFFSKKDSDLVAGATVMTGFKVAIKPKDIVDAESVYNKLITFIP